MDQYQFVKFILSNQSVGKVPSADSYPSNIKLDAIFWGEIKKLFKYTSDYNYEHSTSLYSADGDTVTTPPVKGLKTSVTTKHQVSMKYVPDREGWYKKHIFINGKIVKKYTLKKEKIPKENKILPVFNIHSHPSHQVNDTLAYSFYSSTDVQTLKKSRFLCMGLVTDEFLLLCNTSEVQVLGSPDIVGVLAKLNQKYYRKKEIDIEALESLKLTLYRAEFGKNLVKIV